MKIAIIGTGGIGGYFGGMLARAAFDVNFLARGKHFAAIKSSGLTVKSINTEFHIGNVQIFDRIRDIGISDLIILCVKAWQIKEIREDIKSIMNSDSVVLPLQNGVMAVEELSEVINKSNILGGLCRIISKIESPGIINHFGISPSVTFGEIDKSVSNRVLEIKAVFDKAEINNQISNDIDSDLWKKFIAICASGLLAVSRTTYGEMRELKETREMLIDLLNEIITLAIKIGIKIERDFLNQALSFIDSFPYDSTSSLTRDIWEGKPSEIDYQNGTVVKLGEKFGVPTPVNKFIYNCILPMELKARNQNN